MSAKKNPMEHTAPAPTCSPACRGHSLAPAASLVWTASDCKTWLASCVLMASTTPLAFMEISVMCAMNVASNLGWQKHGLTSFYLF